MVLYKFKSMKETRLSHGAAALCHCGLKCRRSWKGPQNCPVRSPIESQGYSRFAQTNLARNQRQIIG